MTCRELLQLLQTQIANESQIKESEIKMTQVYENGISCVARVMVPLENRTRVIEITTKELCVYEGLEHLAP
jgi:hypothetical protein